VCDAYKNHLNDFTGNFTVLIPFRVPQQCSGVFEGGAIGAIPPQEFLDQDNFYKSNGYFIKKKKL
jgi:hypothetical protein